MDLQDRGHERACTDKARSSQAEDIVVPTKTIYEVRKGPRSVINSK
jgi:hypothetical protein